MLKLDDPRTRKAAQASPKTDWAQVSTAELFAQLQAVRATKAKLLPPLSAAKQRELEEVDERLRHVAPGITQELLFAKRNALVGLTPAIAQQMWQLGEQLTTLNNAIYNRLGNGPRPSTVRSSFREGGAWTKDSRPKLPFDDAGLMALHEKLHAKALPEDPRQREALEVDRWLVTRELRTRFTLRSPAPPSL